MERLRLLTSYRGYRAGKVIEATPTLAAYLVERQIATRELQGSLLAAEPRSAVERAVQTVQAVETR